MACLRLTVTPVSQGELRVNVIQQATLDVSEVCSVSSGTIAVLAASDGPLRTRNGGYILLDPARETDESSTAP